MLKDCPYCHKHPKLKIVHHPLIKGTYSLQCGKHSFVTYPMPTIQEAIDSWNTMLEHIEEVEALVASGMNTLDAVLLWEEKHE